MNYYDNYLSFYSGKNRKEIFLAVCSFIEAWRDDNIAILKDLLCEDVVADISMTGHAEGINQVLEKLIWPGPELDVKRIIINSFVSRSHDDTAQVSFYTQHLYALTDDTAAYPFVFGGQFMNTMKKINGIWKFSHLRFDLCYEGGNNSFVKDHWTLMDYSVLYGHKPMINPELEAPWIAIPEDDEPLSDQEAIFELEYRNNIGMDGGAFQLCHEIFSEEIFLNYSHRKKVSKNYSSAVDGDFHGRKDAVNYFRSKQHKEARLQHIVAMAELNLTKDGNEAKAYMIRSEFHRTNNFILDLHTIHMLPLTAVHEIDAIKENGIWKMKRMAYYPIMEWIPMDDDCIIFDDYVINQRYWKHIKDKIIS